jgi:hypothetical protein
MATAKERIMLSGGVMASMAMSEEAFKRFVAYNTTAGDVFSTYEDLSVVQRGITMHAVFCYGWWDNPNNTKDGWWLCKNRCACLGCHPLDGRELPASLFKLHMACALHLVHKHAQRVWCSNCYDCAV